MTGLELSERYWADCGLPALRLACPALLEHAAAGLAGEGSDCFGYDDALSRDHDWGPGFCLWLDDDRFDAFAPVAAKIYAQLPREFLGFQRLRETEAGAQRVGVQSVSDFCRRLTGLDAPPVTIDEWRHVPEENLAAATNGRVFFDGSGEFSRLRAGLLAYYPEDLRLKKLAMHLALAAQSGQYNYYRCRARQEGTAAMLCLSRFAEHVQSIVFLLNRCYKPYYKWASRRMRELPILGAELASRLESLALGSGDKRAVVEEIAARIIDVLRAEGLSSSDSDYLLPHAEQVQSHIADERLRSLHIMLA